jgi:hypothetical protein
MTLLTPLATMIVEMAREAIPIVVLSVPAIPDQGDRCG